MCDQIADACLGVVRAHALGSHDLDQALFKQRFVAFVRHMEVLSLALDANKIQLLCHFLDHLERLIHRSLALDLDQHGRFGHLCRGVACEHTVGVGGGVKRQVNVKGLAHHVDAGQILSAALEGLALPAGAVDHFLEGKESIFDSGVIILQLGVCLNVAGKEGAAITHTVEGCLRHSHARCLAFGVCLRLGGGLLGCFLGLLLADEAQNICLNGLVQLVKRNTGGQYDLDQALFDQSIVVLVRQAEILCLALDACKTLLLHHRGDQLERLIHRFFALDLDKHGGLGHLIGSVADEMFVLVLGGIQGEVDVKGLALDVDTGQILSAALEGLALPAGTADHLLVGKQLVFDRGIIALQLVGCLDQAGEVRALVADLDGTALLGSRSSGGKALFFLLALAALALQSARFLLGAADLLGQDIVRLQGDDNGFTDTKLVLGQLLFVVH